MESVFADDFEATLQLLRAQTWHSKSRVYTVHSALCLRCAATLCVFTSVASNPLFIFLYAE